MKPCMKPGKTLQYFHPQSNLEAINNRLSNFSSDKQAFNPASPPYQDALDQPVGYNYNLNNIFPNAQAMMMIGFSKTTLWTEY